MTVCSELKICQCIHVSTIFQKHIKIYIFLRCKSNANMREKTKAIPVFGTDRRTSMPT